MPTKLGKQVMSSTIWAAQTTFAIETYRDHVSVSAHLDYIIMVWSQVSVEVLFMEILPDFSNSDIL